MIILKSLAILYLIYSIAMYFLTMDENKSKSDTGTRSIFIVFSILILIYG